MTDEQKFEISKVLLMEIFNELRHAESDAGEDRPDQLLRLKQKIKEAVEQVQCL